METFDPVPSSASFTDRISLPGPGPGPKRLLSKDLLSGKALSLLQRASTVPRPSREPRSCVCTRRQPRVSPATQNATSRRCSHGKCQFANRTIRLRNTRGRGYRRSTSTSSASTLSSPFPRRYRVPPTTPEFPRRRFGATISRTRLDACRRGYNCACRSVLSGDFNYHRVYVPECTIRGRIARKVAPRR